MSEEDDGRTRKRVRVSRACDPCRRRKEKCDGDQPCCQRCTATSRTCFYNPYRRRGLRPGYVRILEIFLGLILHAFDGAEDLLLSVLRQRPDKPSSPINCRLRRQGQSDVVSLLQLWRKSTVLEDLQGALDTVEAVEDEDLYIQGLDTEVTSTFNALFRRSPSETQTWIPEDTSFQPHSPEPNPTVPLPNQQEQSCPVSVLQFSLLSAPRLPANWSRLVDVYVSETHNWLPIIQKYKLFRTASLIARAESNPDSRMPDKGDVALLWAVFAYSSNHADSTCSQTEDGQVSQEGLISHAKAMAMQELPQYDIGHVHASLILALLEMRRGPWRNSWLWVGRAVYTANLLGVIPQGRDHSTDEEIRRCFLGCFVVDSLIATRLGFRPYFQRSDLQGLPDDGPEEWELWRPVSATSAVSPTPGPGRILSTFNSLCYMVAAIGQYSDEETHPRPQLRDLITHLTGRDYHSNLSEPQSEASIASEPPHILQVKLAAATAYLSLPTTDPATDALPSHDAIQKNVSQIVKLVNSERTAFSNPSLPPALQLFTHFLRSNQLLSSRIGIGIPTTSDLQHLDTTSTAVPGPSVHDENTSLPMMAHSPRTTGDLTDTSAFYNMSAASAMAQNPGVIIPSAEGNPSSESSRFIPVQTPPLSIQESQQHPPNLDGHGKVAGPLDEEGSDGLFNQLASLNSSEWPTLPEEFMQHLGLSRDGSLFEFQSLFTSHDR
ncbi:hypothetical protein B0I35DRAFT_48753 [Stachybotrys elegans]|uniref:Zn(2)-C6 fungal-type domain-containing protein n=1 Tax=Stachybotrys elegans TaxID=80388 RepID=A0A8K0T6J4_9HYPO|nr:hypothetical protein B0I35DRAFT_48753 [Stachybotrys elegans]